MSGDIKPPISGYSIWLMPSEVDGARLQQLIDALRQSDDCGFLSHATLIGLLDYADDQRERLIKQTQALAFLSGPVAAELSGVGMRKMFFQSVFLHIVPNRLLSNLNQAARMLFEHSEDLPFMPHISMVYGDFYPEVKGQMGIEIEKSYVFPDTITLDRLALVRVDGYPSDWEIEEEFELIGKT